MTDWGVAGPTIAAAAVAAVSAMFAAKAARAAERQATLIHEQWRVEVTPEIEVECRVAFAENLSVDRESIHYSSSQLKVSLHNVLKGDAFAISVDAKIGGESLLRKRAARLQTSIDWAWDLPRDFKELPPHTSALSTTPTWNELRRAWLQWLDQVPLAETETRGRYLLSGEPLPMIEISVSYRDTLGRPYSEEEKWPLVRTATDYGTFEWRLIEPA